jgi:hypothetical protein
MPEIILETVFIISTGSFVYLVLHTVFIGFETAKYRE